MKAPSALLGVLLVSASLPLCAPAQITIATPAADGWCVLYAFTGFGTGVVYGQTFVVPDATHTQLDRLEMHAAATPSLEPTRAFTTYIAQWDATTRHLVGAPLWTSSLQSASALASRELGGSLVAFDTGGISLTAGQTYVFLSLPNYSGGIVMGYANPGTYAGGSFVAFNLSPGMTETAPAYAILSTVQGSFTSSADLAFGATFSEPGSTAVPEPAAPAAILALALAAGLVALRLRQQRHAAPLAAAGASASLPQP